MPKTYTFPAFHPSRPTRFELARFFSKVQVDRGGCWLWTAAVNGKGYAHFGSTPAHRYAYAWFVAPLAADMTVDHICRTRSCVNPAHLDAVTDSENKQRASVFNRLGRCRRRNHLLAELGVAWVTVRGVSQRVCAECHRLAKARYVLRKHGPNALPQYAVTVLHRERMRLLRLERQRHAA